MSRNSPRLDVSVISFILVAMTLAAYVTISLVYISQIKGTMHGEIFYCTSQGILFITAAVSWPLCVISCIFECLGRSYPSPVVFAENTFYFGHYHKLFKRFFVTFLLLYLGSLFATTFAQLEFDGQFLDPRIASAFIATNYFPVIDIIFMFNAWHKNVGPGVDNKDSFNLQRPEILRNQRRLSRISLNSEAEIATQKCAGNYDCKGCASSCVIPIIV
eukprot:TRINITY_DN14781_c0_g1_i1.p1 TRINITY_DN14781_c0_g1~~TRINITY_DN14781_c0_g1_i1.p1  ORF type:complete len:217 (+),score=8.22 TRINITY_DN14781_c0_g1_i1:384-1034(+)